VPIQWAEWPRSALSTAMNKSASSPTPVFSKRSKFREREREMWRGREREWERMGKRERKKEGEKEREKRGGRE